MSTYIIRRLVLMVPTMIGITLLVALMTRSLPGDVVDVLAASQGFTDQEKVYLRHELGVDKPLIPYYVGWVGKMLHGDFGRSLRTEAL